MHYRDKNIADNIVNYLIVRVFDTIFSILIFEIVCEINRSGEKKFKKILVYN